MIYGEVKEGGLLPVDISKVLTGSGSYFGPDSGKRAFDKDTSTHWSATPYTGSPNSWFGCEFDAPKLVTKVYLMPYGSGYRPLQIRVDASNDRFVTVAYSSIIINKANWDGGFNLGSTYDTFEIPVADISTSKYTCWRVVSILGNPFVDTKECVFIGE